MRRWFAWWLLLMLSVATTVSAITPQKRALIQELLAVSGAADITVGYIADLYSEQYPRPKAMATADWMRQTMGSSADFKRLVENTQTDIYDRYFTEKQLQDLIAFYKSDAGRRLVEVQSQIAADARTKVGGALVDELQRALQVSKQKRAKADVLTIATALEARAVDENAYPPSASIESIAKLLEPTYIRETPKVDGWGNPYRYFGSADKEHYRVASAGPDGKLDAATSVLGKLPPATSDDIIFEDGQFVMPPAAK